MFESKQPAVVPLASKMTNHPMEMDREDDQPVLPRETVESAVHLTVATANKPILDGPIQ